MTLDLSSRNGLSLIIDELTARFEGKPFSVLELGPAEGRLTKYLAENMGAAVDIVEIDGEAGKNAARFARNACLGEIEGDLDGVLWPNRLKSNRYDAVVFADVLEHLRNSADVLKKCRSLMKDDGVVLVSVPNIAHNSVLINLINNEFQYTSLGLLDNTHIHFFTGKSFRRMARESGYAIIREQPIDVAVGKNEIPCLYTMVNKATARELKLRNAGETYQYVFTLKKADNENSDPPKVEESVCAESGHYFGEFFVKCADDTDYTPQNSKMQIINVKANAATKAELNLADFPSAKSLRFDPLNANCILKVSAMRFITADNTEVKIDYAHNGVKVNDVLLFAGDDPQIYFDSVPDNAKSFVAEYRILDFDDDNIGSLAVEANIFKEKFNRLKVDCENIAKDRALVDADRRRIDAELKAVKANRDAIIADREKILAEKNETERKFNSIRELVVQTLRVLKRRLLS